VTRFFDIVLSFMLMSLLAPFLLPIAIALLLTGEHHVFYLQPRVGRGGRDFPVIKFATMLKDSPNMPGGFITQKNDPRVLPMGGFLRKTKINELPQLANIFVGQMSFVGPRPLVRRHLELYSPEVRQAIASERPGLTGIGSLVFRDEEGILDRMPGDRKTNHDKIVAPYKGALELWYRDHRGPATYFLLIALTAWSVVRPGSRAYRKAFADLPPPPAELARYL
jgi:lipopolysaccharide/colanic/teichoic acid biosynthesis glycosyltransferase